MLLNIWIFATVALCYAAAVQLYEEDTISRAFADQDYISQEREKRSVARAASVGLKAVDRLLKGAVKDPTAPMDARQLVYAKRGDMFKAVKDFYNVGVKQIRGPRGKKNIDCGYSIEAPGQGGFIKCPQSIFGAEDIAKVGTVGDRTVIIGRRGSGEATVTIIKTKEVGNPNAVQTVIHYNKDGSLPGFGNPFRD